ncbi:hypothetical protein MC885_014386, partial [Smutsia gigantea]
MSRLRGLSRGEAAGSVGLAFDQQSLGLLHLSLCPLLTLFPLRGHSFRQAWYWGWQGGVAPAGAISVRDNPARKQRKPPARRSLCGSKKRIQAAMEWDNGTGLALGSPPTTCVYRENFKRLLLPPVYSVVLVAGVPLNACVIAQICTSRRALTRTAVYTLNLALADLLYACSLPLLIYNYAQGDHWPFGDLACRLVRFLFYA